MSSDRQTATRGGIYRRSRAMVCVHSVGVYSKMSSDGQAATRGVCVSVLANARHICPCTYMTLVRHAAAPQLLGGCSCAGLTVECAGARYCKGKRVSLTLRKRGCPDS